LRKPGILQLEFLDFSLRIILENLNKPLLISNDLFISATVLKCLGKRFPRHHFLTKKQMSPPLKYLLQPGNKPDPSHRLRQEAE
jgi:hypothetical protein